jgi:hypothetical protein
MVVIWAGRELASFPYKKFCDSEVVPAAAQFRGRMPVA